VLIDEMHDLECSWSFVEKGLGQRLFARLHWKWRSSPDWYLRSSLQVLCGRGSVKEETVAVRWATKVLGHGLVSWLSPYLSKS